MRCGTPSRCPLSPPWLVWRRSCSLARSVRPLRKPPQHPPSRCVGAATWVLGHCGVSAGTPAAPASAPAGLRQPSPRYPPSAPAGCRVGKASAIAPLVPACCECEAGGGCGGRRVASLVLMVLCLQAAPSPASRLSPSEEAQRRLERIFTASVIPGALALACWLPGDGDMWAACGCPGRTVCSARGDCSPVPGYQPCDPSLGGIGSRGQMTRDARGCQRFWGHCPDQCARLWGAVMPSSPCWWHPRGSTGTAARGWGDAQAVPWGLWPCLGPVARSGAAAALCLSLPLFSFLSSFLAAVSWTPPPPPRHPARYRTPILRSPLPPPVTPRRPLSAAGLASAPAPRAGA